MDHRFFDVTPMDPAFARANLAAARELPLLGIRIIFHRDRGHGEHSVEERWIKGPRAAELEPKIQALLAEMDDETEWCSGKEVSP